MQFAFEELQTQTDYGGRVRKCLTQVACTLRKGLVAYLSASTIPQHGIIQDVNKMNKITLDLKTFVEKGSSCSKCGKKGTNIVHISGICKECGSIQRHRQSFDDVRAATKIMVPRT